MGHPTIERMAARRELESTRKVQKEPHVGAPKRTTSYVFLCVFPFLTIGLTGLRTLRGSWLDLAVGAAMFFPACFALSTLGGAAFVSAAEHRRLLALAGTLLLTPFLLISLLWVGIGTPWEATPTENRLRYLVLLAGAMAVASGFIVSRRALEGAGERIYSTLGAAANVFAGSSYLIWLALHVGVYDLKIREGEVPQALIALANVFDVLLFAACVLTYLAAAAFAASMGRAALLGRGAARVFIAGNLIGFVFIVVRGLSFPDPTSATSPWFAQPGFVAGIPAVPWIMPYLLGVVLLRRSGTATG